MELHFLFFFFGPAVDFFLLKIPATGEEPFSSENRTQNGRVLFLPQLYALDRFWIFMLRQIEHFFFLSKPYHFTTMVIINGKLSVYLNVTTHRFSPILPFDVTTLKGTMPNLSFGQLHSQLGF